MTPEDFQKFFPLIDNWIRAALSAHAGTARSVASCGFPRLPLYFTAETLASAKVVIMDRLPIPPLSSWRLTQFASFERREQSASFARALLVWNALDIGTVRWKSWPTTQKHGLWLLQLDSTQKSWWLENLARLEY